MDEPGVSACRIKLQTIHPSSMVNYKNLQIWSALQTKVADVAVLYHEGK
jgi:hypothetical protein